MPHLIKNPCANIQIPTGIFSFDGVGQPRWLKNKLDDDIWYLKGSLPAKTVSTFTINWRYQRWSQSDISTGRLDSWLTIGKRLAYHCMESEKTLCKKTTSLAGYAREIRTICYWFCNERKCIDVASMTPEDIVAFESHLSSLKLTVNTVLTKLVLLRMMWVLRSEINGGLRFDPYMQPGSIKARAKSIGVSGGHTPTIKPLDFFYLLNKALEIIDKSQVWIELLDEYLNIPSSDSRKNTQQFFAQTGIKVNTLKLHIREIYAAAIIIVLSLTGERKHEFSATKFDDVANMLAANGNELIGTVYKTAQTLGGRKTNRPVVNEVKTALTLILKLTTETKRLYQGNLFILRLPFSTGAEDFLTEVALYRHLDIFTKCAGINWKLRPHMLRRAFSMLWAWRYEIGDLYHLSKMLYHNNELFTKSYTEDEDVWEFLPDAERSLAYDVMEKSLLGQKKIYGGFGRTITRYRRFLLSSVTILTPETVQSFIDGLFQKSGYRIIPHADGYCVMSSVRARRAKCTTDGRTPNYKNRAESLCVTCPNFGVDESRRVHWERRLIAHQEVYSNTNIEILKTASKLAIERSEEIIRCIDGGGKYDGA